MTGQALFNEVFFDDAVVPAENIIGGEGNGWAVTQTTLLFERIGIGAGGSFGRAPNAGVKNGILTQPNVGEAAKAFAIPSGPATVALPDLIALAHSQGRAGDPLIREKLATLACYTDTGRWTARRAVDADDPATSNRLALLGKVAQTRIVKLAAEIGMDLLGPEAMLWPPDGPDGGPVLGVLRVLQRLVHLRRHRSDPAQRHLRARARHAPGSRPEQDRAVPRSARKPAPANAERSAR